MLGPSPPYAHYFSSDQLCRVAAWNTSAYEWAHHEPLARAAGMTVDQLSYLRQVPASRRLNETLAPKKGLFSPQQSAVLALVDHSTINVKVPKNVFEEAKDYFDDKVLAEIMITCAAYNMVSRFLVGMDVLNASEVPVGELDLQ